MCDARVHIAYPDRPPVQDPAVPNQGWPPLSQATLTYAHTNVCTDARIHMWLSASAYLIFALVSVRWFLMGICMSSVFFSNDWVAMTPRTGRLGGVRAMPAHMHMYAWTCVACVLPYHRAQSYHAAPPERERTIHGMRNSWVCPSRMYPFLHCFPLFVHVKRPIPRPDTNTQRQATIHT